MFGYIRPDYGELKTKHVSLYRSVYCGICRTGGKRISHLTRTLLNYDFVFLAVARLALTVEEYKIVPRRCLFSPKKKGVMEPNDALTFTAAAFGSLLYYKALDDAADEKGFKRFYTKLSLPLFKRMAKRAEKLCAGMGERIKQNLEKLSVLEKEECDIPDKVADCFAALLADLLSYGLTGGTYRIARDIGYHTGRFIYLADALDDIDKDEKAGAYNPYLLCYGSAEKVRENISFIRQTLTDSGAALSTSYALADGNNFDGIIYNIAGYGFTAAIDKVINKENTK